MTDPALFDLREAADYLGVSKSYFDDHLRKYLPVVDMKRPDAKQPMPRWAKADLDHFIDTRRKEKRAS